MPDPEPPLAKTIRADLSHISAQRRSARIAAGATLGVAAALVVALIGVWIWRLALADLPAAPDQAALWRINQPPSIRFEDVGGRDIGWRGPARGEVLKLSDLPPYVPRAFLAAEDRRFYSHFGIDLIGIARAARADLQARRVVEGGSTVTQQIARTLFLTPDQTLRRKIQEAVLAVEIERRMGKDEVLKLYLNRIYFGGGSYGIEAAAQSYFGKPARALTLAEAAILAALPKAPTRLDPSNNFQAALARSHLVLARMQAEGWITAQERARAVAAPPTLVPDDPNEGVFGYVLDFAAPRARELAPPNQPALVVRLSVDARLQAEAVAAIGDAVRANANRGATQGALVALGPEGAIRALVGGVDHRDSAFNRAVQAQRQPGSAFKPFVYAAALEAGLTPRTVRTDAPVRFGDWAPQNATRGYAGEVTLSDALARSINTISAKLTKEVGPEKVAATARRFGLVDIPPKPSLSVALGSYETSLIHLAEGYQVFQQGGRRSFPYLIESISTPDGRPIYRRTGSAPAPVYPEALNGQMVAMMQGVINKGTGKRAAFGRPAAGKTGTNQDNRDAWFMGFTPDLVAGVWIGDDRNRPMHDVSGGELAAETWRRFMVAAHEGLPVRDFGTAPADLAGQDARDAFYRDLAAEFTRTEALGANP
ncbi:MAG TPA: PBP1A family penicillin-binding protein [Caulobacteraceae bacterium]|nr:PBP1A family penicillin-binding protein [Caulobacteraceae bacterium]